MSKFNKIFTVSRNNTDGREKEKTMDTLQICNYCVTYSQETLRYFFSSVFQGYAALFTIAGMFYIYFSQSIEKKLDNIREKVKNSVNIILGPRGSESRELLERNPVDYIENHVNLDKSKEEPWTSVFTFGLTYRILQNQVGKFKKYMFRLLPLSTFILILSLFALFFIKLNDSKVINQIVFISGIIILILSCVYFYFLFMMVKEILTIFHFRIKEKKELDMILKKYYIHVIKHAE